jgi:hypothetical protein
MSLLISREEESLGTSSCHGEGKKGGEDLALVPETPLNYFEAACSPDEKFRDHCPQTDISIQGTKCPFHLTSISFL